MVNQVKRYTNCEYRDNGCFESFLTAKELIDHQKICPKNLTRLYLLQII